MTVLDPPKRPTRQAVAAPEAKPHPRPVPYRFTLGQYLWLSDQGVFDGQRVEFIDGEIITMPAQRNRHGCGVSQSCDALTSIFPKDRFWVRSQMTLLVNGGAPDPDVVVVAGPRVRDEHIPSAADALIVVEVSDTTLLYDRQVKSHLFAAGGIADYVIVNVVDRQLEVHRDPVAAKSGKFTHRYKSVTILKPGQTFTPLAAPQASVAVDDFM